MATIINTPSPERVVAVDRASDSSGWAVAVVILIAVIALGAWAWVHYRGTAAAPSGGTNINVTLPTKPAETTP